MKSFNGLNIVIVDRVIWAIPEWRMDIFPNGMDAWLPEQWIENKSCPPRGMITVNVFGGRAFCDLETWQALKNHFPATMDSRGMMI